MTKRPSFALVLLYMVLLCMLIAASRRARATDQGTTATTPALIPWPKTLRVGKGTLTLSAGHRIIAATPSLAPLAQILSDEIFMATGLCLPIAQGTPATGDIGLALDATLTGEAYILAIDRSARVRGADYNAVAMGSVTLLQAIIVAGKRISLPALTVADHPGSVYCGTMLDVARQRHPIAALRPVVEMCRLYKIRYLHLHLTDDQLFMFPSTAYPKIGAEGYKRDELMRLVAYADARGVTLVPEIEMPGHSSVLVAAMPEVFGARDPATGKYRGLGVLNIANDAIYPVLETLIGEVCDVFRSSPYLHIGGDEADWSAFDADPMVRAYKQQTHQETGQLFARFLNHIHAIVKRHGKQTIVWEGFGPGLEVDRDIIVMAWHGSSHPPKALLDAGYRIINVPWTPGIYHSVAEVYHWNLYHLNLNEHDQSVQLPPTPAVLGAQMVLWERAPQEALPMLRTKAPARQERVYSPNAGRSAADFEARLAVTDRLLQRLLYPVDIAIHGLLSPDERNFAAPITLRMTTPFAGTEIRYTLTGEEPTPTSPRYTEPVPVTAAQAKQVYLPAYYGRQAEIRARCFQPDGTPIGETTLTTVRNDAPRLTYALYRPASGKATFLALPDFSALTPFETGVLGRIGSAANFQRGKGPLALVAKAQFEAEGDGDYTFTLAAFPAGRLLFDDMPVCEMTVASGNRSVQGTARLTKGRHRVRIEYGTNDGTVQLDVSIETFPVRTRHHWEDRGLYEWLVPL
jgi:hexosaminidase